MNMRYRTNIESSETFISARALLKWGAGILALLVVAAFSGFATMVFRDHDKIVSIQSDVKWIAERLGKENKENKNE